MQKYHDEDNNAESLDSSGYESKTMDLGDSNENTSTSKPQNNEEEISGSRDYDETKSDTERKSEPSSSRRAKTADGTQTEKSYIAENKREEDVSGLPIQHQAKSTRSNSPSSTYYYDAYNSLTSTGKSSSKRRTRNDSRDAESIEEKIRKIEEEIERLQNRVNQNSKKSKIGDAEEEDNYLENGESGNASKSSTATPGKKRNTKSNSKFPPINGSSKLQEEEKEEEVDMTEYINQAKDMTLPEIKRYYLHYENQLFRKGYDLPDFMPFCPPLHSKYSKEVLKAQADRHNEKRIEVLALALKDFPLPSSCAGSKRTSKASSIAIRQSIKSNLSATVPVESNNNNNNNYENSYNESNNNEYSNESEREYQQPGGGSGDEEEEEDVENEERREENNNNNNNKSQVSSARNSTRSSTNKYMSEDNQTLIQQRIAHNMKEASHRKYVLTHEIDATKKRLADYERSQRELEQRKREREKEEEKKRQEHQRELEEKEAHRIFNLQRARKLEEARLNRLKAKLHYQELKVERDKLLAAQQMQQHIEWVKEQNKLRKDRYDEAERLRKQRIKDYENYQKMQTEKSNAQLKARNDSWAERKRQNDLAQMERDHKVLMAERRRLGRQMGYEEKYLEMKRRLEKMDEENEIMKEQSKDMRRADLMAKYQLEADIKRFLKPSPGPCSYNPKSFVEEWIPGSKINAPTTKENEELLMHLKGRSPGPIDYADFGYHSSTPIYSIGNAAPTHHGDEVPGPNTYDVGRTYKPDSPYYSVPRSIPITDSDLMLYQAANSPSPVEYAPPIKEIASMRRTGFDSSKFNVPPKKRNVLFKTGGF